LIGFLLGGVPGFLIGGFTGSPLDENISVAAVMGLLFGGLAAIFGKRMIAFLIDLLKGGWS
jgi:hypothetical protein